LELQFFSGGISQSLFREIKSPSYRGSSSTYRQVFSGTGEEIGENPDSSRELLKRDSQVMLGEWNLPGE
jgi:hypothetical protein